MEEPPSLSGRSLPARLPARRADVLWEKHPKLVAMMDESHNDVLAYMGFPREYGSQLASTNPIERLQGEMKRLSDVADIFPNDKAVVRLLGAPLLKQSKERLCFAAIRRGRD